jgi:integrase
MKHNLKKELHIMEFVQPIRKKDDIEKVKSNLLKNGYRDYLLFVAGINTGLRISDLLKLRVRDVQDKTHLEIREAKTGKSKRFYINPTLKTCLDNYVQNMAAGDFLFQSRKGENKPLTRVQAYRIINDAVKDAGVCDRIGTHTLRKTFGYWHYQLFKDVAVLQDIFNHSAPSVTLRYIGINADIVDKTIAQFAL